MKKGLMSVGFLMLVGTVPFSAWAASCPATSFPSIQVQLLDPQPQILTVKTLKQINASAVGHGLMQKDKMVLGTTESRTETDMNIQFAWHKLRRGQQNLVCVSVKSINVRFGNSKLLVDLPREYARGSCQYNVVHRHEMAHVEVNRGGVRKYAAVLNSELSQELQRSWSMESTTMSRGTKVFQNRLKAITQKVTDRFKKEIKVLHGKIDAPNSPYAAKGACRSW